jgi:amidohydrolase
VASPGGRLVSAGLLDRARELADELTAMRRHLHEQPETAWQERDTQAYLRERLTAGGFACRDVAGTGLLAEVPGGDSTAPAVALRAELDALPIEERNEAPYRSRRPGAMHACGHDAHMTMVFGAGRLLAERAASRARRVVLLFQPAEEVPPGGARRVLDEGALSGANVGAIFGLHVDPRYPAGTLLLRRGPLMAASDRFEVRVTGRGGHGGYPHLTVDPIVAAAQVVVALQSIVARRLDPVEPGVITVGRIHGGTADNIIPDEVVLSGTIRSHAPAVRRQLPEWIRETAEGTALAHGARAEFTYLPGHPGLANNPAVIDAVERALVPVLGREALVDLPRPIMGGEDFAHYLETIPGAFLRIGVRNEERGVVHSIHSPRFDIDEAALPVGAAALAAVAEAWSAGVLRGTTSDA